MNKLRHLDGLAFAVELADMPEATRAMLLRHVRQQDELIRAKVSAPYLPETLPMEIHHQIYRDIQRAVVTTITPEGLKRAKNDEQVKLTGLLAESLYRAHMAAFHRATAELMGKETAAGAKAH